MRIEVFCLSVIKKILVILIVVLGFSDRVFAQTLDWDNEAGTYLWPTGLNWDPDVIPDTTNITRLDIIPQDFDRPRIGFPDSSSSVANLKGIEKGSLLIINE